MAAFSYEQHQVPLLLDSLFSPNNATPSPIKNMSNMSGFIDEAAAAGNFINDTNCFSQFYQLETFPLDVGFHKSSGHLDHSSNETCVNKKQSTESSAVVDNKLESGEQVTQKVTSTPPMDRKRKKNNGSFNSAQSKDHGREGKGKKQTKCSGDMKEEGKKPKLAAEKKAPEEPPTGYIHVRARRGQATDSHSLAERVRREKISERMKILQRLVPGCDKVTGKALMLDEIINYVQSLQSQVEFLSMKLASVNPLFYDFGMDIDDAFMIRPERLRSMSSPPLPSLQQCSPVQPTAFADATTTTTATATTTATSTAPTTTTFATANNYPLIDGSVLLHGMRPIDDFTTQDCGSLMWDAAEQSQKLLNPSGFTNNLCSFH